MKHFCIVLFLFVFVSGVYAGGGDGSSYSRGVKVRTLRRYRGTCRLDRSGKKYLVIRSRAAYHRFIRTIPKREIGMGPTRASRDYLLKRPRVDFRKNTFVVVFNRRPTVFSTVMITDVVRKPDAVWVFYYMPRRLPNRPIQWPYGMGRYYAAVIPGKSLPVRFARVFSVSEK